LSSENPIEVQALSKRRVLPASMRERSAMAGVYSSGPRIDEEYSGNNRSRVMLVTILN
jgi:hypothetical protein